jgi:hypothetical protein
VIFPTPELNVLQGGTFLGMYQYVSVEITNKMQLCNRIYFSTVHWRLNVFRAAYRLSSGALTVFAASGLHTHVVNGRSQVWVGTHWRLNMFWAVCCSKHVEPSMNSGIINSVTKLHLVGYFYWVTLRCTDPWILNVPVCLSSHKLVIICSISVLQGIYCMKIF